MDNGTKAMQKVISPDGKTPEEEANSSTAMLSLVMVETIVIALTLFIVGVRWYLS